MSKTQVQGLLVVVLLALMGLVWVLNRGPAPERMALKKVSDEPAQPSQPEIAPAAAPEPAASGEPASLARDYFQLPSALQQKLDEKRRLEEEAKRPKGPAQAQTPWLSAAELAQKFQLQGIFWGIAKPQAVINRRILSVGDKIEEAEVTSITQDRVVLSFEGQEITLTPGRESGSSHDSVGAPPGTIHR